MDYFKPITVAGIIITAILGIMNLWLALNNRRNALREHLFKEQIEYFKKLTRQLVLVSSIFDNVQLKKELDENTEEKLNAEIENLHRLFDENLILLPNVEMFDIIAKVLDEADQLYIRLVGVINVEKEVYEPFFKAYTDAIDDIRDYYKVEELSAETLSLSTRRFSRKSKEEEVTP